MKTTDQPRAFGGTEGFTLIELLAVMSIMLMMMALVSPSISTVIMGTNLNRAGVIVSDNLALARQEAVSMNRDIQVRFFDQTNGAQTTVRGIQLWRMDEGASGPEPKAITRIVWFPERITVNMDEMFSPLLTEASLTGNANIAGVSTHYRGFRIRANGTLDSSTDQTFLTIQNANDSATAPKNFYTIQMNPITARVTIYRP